MAEILLCNRSFSSHQLKQLCSLTHAELQVLDAQPQLFRPHHPYLLSPRPSAEDRGIVSVLNSAPPRQLRNLTEISLDFDGESTLALAEVMEMLRSEPSLAMTGAGTSVYSERMNAFGCSVQKYQDALLRYRKAVEAKASAAVMGLARQHAQNTFNEMQSEFRHELKAVTSRIKARRGTVLGNSDRALNIATSSRSATKLNVMSQVEAHNLLRFSKYATHLGNGLVAIDFASRVANVHNAYQAGGNWERELFIESTSFAASTATGVATAKAGVAALGFVVALTPVGWVGLIVAGVAIAGVSAGAAIGMNSFIKSNSGSWYDAIMQEVSNL